MNSTDIHTERNKIKNTILPLLDDTLKKTLRVYHRNTCKSAKQRYCVYISNQWGQVIIPEIKNIIKTIDVQYPIEYGGYIIKL